MTAENNKNNNNEKRNARLFLRDYKGPVPVFYESEVLLEEMLGQGSFCAAFTIRHIQLFADERAEALPNQEKRQTLTQQINNSSRSKSLRCVAKKPRNDFYANCKHGDRSHKDLKEEFKILHRVGMGQHPNVIELHGVGISAIKESEENSKTDKGSGITFKPTFLILNRIKYSIQDLIVQWRDQRGLGVYQALSLGQDNTRQLWKERMSVLAQIAHGIEYIHSKRIIIRDLKPENVGTDYHGVVKIFDFGLATLIDKEHHAIDRLYHLTGDTGTPRYMPPEVAKHKKYGYSADVYCLAIFMHEVLSLKTPFASVSPNAYRERVYDKGVRPSLEMAWPVRLRELLQSMWVADPTQRPTAAEVAKSLSEMLKGNEEVLYPSALFSRSRWFPSKQQQQQQQQNESSADASSEGDGNDEEQPNSSPKNSKNRWFPLKQQQPAECDLPKEANSL